MAFHLIPPHPKLFPWKERSFPVFTQVRKKWTYGIYLIFKVLTINLIFSGLSFAYSIGTPTASINSQQQMISGIFDDIIPSTGGLEICNRSSNPYINVAYGRWRSRRRGWASSGWYRINQGTCRYVINAPLKNRYYYYYAKGSNGGVWKGEYNFCAPSHAFTDYHISNCVPSDRKSFRQINVGSSYDYTLNLR